MYALQTRTRYLIKLNLIRVCNADVSILTFVMFFRNRIKNAQINTYAWMKKQDIPRKECPAKIMNKAVLRLIDKYKPVVLHINLDGFLRIDFSG